MRTRIVLSWMLLFAVFSALSRAQVVVTDDANTSSFTPKTNYGSSIALIVCSGSNTYIKFSFANLPSGINGTSISGANAVLYVDAVLASGTMDVYAVNGSWSEGTITYNSAPVLGNKILSAVSVSKTGYLSLNLTSTVQAWLNGTLANNGIALVPSSGSSISVSFDSKENIFTSHTTQLPLVLVSAGPQGPQGPQGLTGAAGPQGAVGPPGPAGATGAAGPAGQQGPQGLTGMTGATGAAGAAGPAGANGTGFNFRNSFDNSASYAVNDVVTFQGASYVATTANQGPNNPTPDQNSSSWSVMAAQGAAGAAGAQGPSGSAGPVGPAGPAGATGPAGPAGPVGPPGAGTGGFNGVQEFTTSGTFTVPAGITHILVEMWGAGGGGGGGGAGVAVGPYFFEGAAGGGAGGGGYTLAVISVTPGSVYTISVGAGGAGGQGGCSSSYSCTVQSATAGQDGTGSQVLDSSSAVIATAAGGQAGGAGGAAMSINGSYSSTGGTGGAGGAAGSGASVIGRSGSGGQTGPGYACYINFGGYVSCVQNNQSAGASGTALAAYLDPGAGNGGSSGAGDLTRVGGGVGGNGNNGYVLIRW
jgi:hypothetical protein